MLCLATPEEGPRMEEGPPYAVLCHARLFSHARIRSPNLCKPAE